MGKKNSDQQSGSKMNIPDHISKSLETTFWVKNTELKFFDADPGFGIFLTLDPRWKKNSDPV
jgi:hypothetical protein